MRLRLRSRLFLLSVGLITVVGIPTGIFLENRLRRVLTDQIEFRLQREAALAGVALAAVGSPDSIEQIDRVADTLGDASRLRVTVIGEDGRVLGDSRLSVKEVNEVEAHDNRPEVADALQTGLGRSSRYSTTLGTDMLYVARADGEFGVVRVATPLSEVDSAVTQLRVVLWLGAGLALVMAGLLGALASQLTLRPLLSLVERARSLTGVAEGDRGGLSEELGYVAGSLERLAQELNKNMSALAAERDRLDAVLRTMGEGLVAVSEDMRVQLLNPAARAVLGSKKATEGSMLVELCRAPALSDLARAGLTQAVAGEFELGAPPRSIAVSGAPLRNPGGVLLVLRDVTEVRRLEAVRRDFVANISHELRTPVSVIRANSETLLAGALEDEKQGRVFASAILRHAERLSNLLSDLLDLGRLEADAYRMDFEWLPVQGTFELALSTVAPLAEKRSVTITVEPATGAVRCDGQAITQVLVNLLENAVKYTPEGGHVWLSAQLHDATMRFEVRDDGPGVEKKHRGRLFERFYRADAGRSRQMGGTGLGLSIVKHLVINMGGSVGMEPNEPRGSCFWFSLPGAPDMDAVPDEPAQGTTAVATMTPT